MRTSVFLALAYLLAACGAPPAKPEPPRAVDQATVPLHVEGNRPYIDVTFRKADGETHTARFLVDTGGGGFLLTDPLARELGLAPGETHEGKARSSQTPPRRCMRSSAACRSSSSRNER